VTGVVRFTVCQPLAAVLEGHAGELRSGRGPQIKKIRAGVAGAAVEFERGDMAGNGGRELHAEFEWRPVIKGGQRRVFDAVKRLTVAGAVATVRLRVSLAARPPRSVAEALMLRPPQRRARVERLLVQVHYLVVLCGARLVRPPECVNLAVGSPPTLCRDLRRRQS
jgi:hypothetical protein